MMFIGNFVAAPMMFTGSFIVALIIFTSFCDTDDV